MKTQQTDSRTQVQSVEPSNMEPKTLIADPAQSLFAHGDRAEFYTGHDRMTLQLRYVARVRDLQEINDNLQRQVLQKEKELVDSQDRLTVLAEIEHCNVMIARNTGEILTVYSQNEQRLRRIAELESQNINLQQDMSDVQSKFIPSHDMVQRTKFAAEFFAIKGQFEKNCVEIRELSHQ